MEENLLQLHIASCGFLEMNSIYLQLLHFFIFKH